MGCWHTLKDCKRRTYIWGVNVEAKAVFSPSRHPADHGFLSTHVPQVIEIKFSVVSPVGALWDCFLGNNKVKLMLIPKINDGPKPSLTVFQKHCHNHLLIISEKSL